MSGRAKQRDTDLPGVGSLWRAGDGRLMRLEHWIQNRLKPTAMMVVLNPGPRMRNASEQALERFGTFLVQEPES